MLANIPTDRGLLRKWLKAGYFEGKLFHTTEQGTPQGGILSPTMANMTLDGLEAHVLAAVPCHKRGEPSSKVHVIRYADDLVATANTREILEEHVIPAITAFLKARGLRLSERKSRIVHIDEGFDFLGTNVRKYSGKLLIRPNRDNVASLIRRTRSLIRLNCGAKTENLLGQLNPLLQGWAYQFRHLVAAKTFQYIDFCVFRQLWKWALRRHNNKGKRWVKTRYFSTMGNVGWLFHTKRIRPGESPQTIALFRTSSLPIRRHVKVRSVAKYFDSRYAEYFKERQQKLYRFGFRSRHKWTSQQLELPF